MNFFMAFSFNRSVEAGAPGSPSSSPKCIPLMVPFEYVLIKRVWIHRHGEAAQSLLSG